MKKAMRVILPIILVIAIIGCTIWYLFVYDRPFARDMLLSCARFSEEIGYFSTSTWFYDLAYDLAESDGASRDQVAIELAEQYKKAKNYTKAEYTLTNAIADGGGVDLYIALCKTYIEQDKLYDAVNMLDSITNPKIKKQIDQMRPAAPTLSPDSGLYNQYISVSVTAKTGTLYVAIDGRFPSVKDQPYSESIALKDGENTICAVVLSDNGLVSSLTTGTYTIGGVIKEVSFADGAIESAIREKLNVSADRILYTNDLWKITEFTVPAEAQNYSDLQHMIFLTSLTIENCADGDLSYLANMTALTDLTIKNTIVDKTALDAIGKLTTLTNLTLQACNLSNISALSNLTAVENIDLSHNAINDISALSGMKNLKNINLEHNVITEISPLSGLSGFVTLDISNNVITSLAPISDHQALSRLDAGTNSISDLGKLKDLSSLEYLCLGNNKLTTVNALENCTQLTELDISGNVVTDIAKIASLTKLMYFDFSNNQVTKLPEFTVDCDLVTITGSHNNISSLEPLSGLSKLNNVHMDYNAELSSVSCLAR